METKQKGFFLMALLFIWGNVVLAQSGWVQEKGGLYAQVSGVHFSSDKYFGVNGDANPFSSEYRQQALNLYGEYGFSPRFTAILNSSALRFNSFPTTNVVAAPGDLRLGLKYAISKKIPISLAVAPEIPLGKKDNFAVAKKANDLGFKEKINLATTDGELNVWTTLAISTPLPQGKGWVNLHGSHNLRTKGFSDQLQTGLEIGFKPIEKFYLKGSLATLISLGSPKENVPFFRGEGTEFTAAALGAGWQFGQRLGLIVEYWRSFDFFVDPKNVYLGAVLNIGISYQIKPG
ncbi:MAG: hypothetical protein R2825_23570 [Saprospiraceae bacterium]